MPLLFTSVICFQSFLSLGHTAIAITRFSRSGKKFVAFASPPRVPRQMRDELEFIGSVFVWFWLRFRVCRHWTCSRRAIACPSTLPSSDGAMRTSTPFYYEIFSHFCLSFGINSDMIDYAPPAIGIAHSALGSLCVTFERGNWIICSCWRRLMPCQTIKSTTEQLIDLFVTRRKFREGQLGRYVHEVLFGRQRNLTGLWKKVRFIPVRNYR